MYVSRGRSWKSPARSRCSGKGKKGKSGHLHHSSPWLLHSHGSFGPDILDKWVLQWLPVLANLYDSCIINPEKPPDTIPGIRPEFPGDGY